MHTLKTGMMKRVLAAMAAAGMATVAGAADATKGFAIRTYYDVSHSSAGVGESTRTISAEAIAAGEVTVPCAIHYLEDTNGDAKGLVVGVTVTSEDGDASGISFVLHEPGDEYFTDRWSGTWNGTDFSMTTYMGFAGVVKYNKKLGYYFSPDGTGYYFFTTAGQTFAGTANAFTSCAWIAPVSGPYQWTGATSDENPLFVFDVILSKDTPAGTYTVKFCEWDTDPTDGNEIPAPMVEAMDGTMYTRKAGNLTLSSLTITVKGATPVSTRAGDANCDGNVDLSDAILVMQALYNSDKYGVDGSDPTHITAQGMINADVDGETGVTPKDALKIQQYVLSLTTDLSHTAQSSMTSRGPLGNTQTLWGDANLDGKVTVADAVAILQDLAYPDKYQLKPQGRINADVDKKVVGVSPGDAYVIKQVDARLVSQDSLPLNAN